jgi:radical SAM protein with 4Fe4S-binding SPASM domain
MKYFNTYKIFSHLDRVEDLKDNKVPDPITVSFTLTDKCNNKCPRCMEVSGRNPCFPSMKDPEIRIAQIAESNAKAITFSGGGEPLLHPQAVETMAIAKTLGLEVGLVTNASLLNKTKADKLSKICTWIKISLDASNPQEYTSTHGMPKQAFQVVVDNILYLARHKKKCIVGVAYLVGENTKDGVMSSARFWRDKGVNYLNFRPFQGDKYDYMDLISATKKYETDSFKIVWKDYKFSDWWNITYKKCYFQYLYPLVNCDGYVYPCCDMRGKKEYRFGNYYKDSLVDIFKRKRKPLYGFKDCIENCIGHGCNKLLSDVYTKKIDQNFL